MQWDEYAYLDSQKELARRNAVVKKPVARPHKPDKKAWSEKIAGKEKREERRDKRKAIKDELRRKREAEREKELGEMEEELEEDWKELRRERKKQKKEKGNGVKNDAAVESSIPEFDL